VHVQGGGDGGVVDKVKGRVGALEAEDEVDDVGHARPHLPVGHAALGGQGEGLEGEGPRDGAPRGRLRLARELVRRPLLGGGAAVEDAAAARAEGGEAPRDGHEEEPEEDQAREDGREAVPAAARQLAGPEALEAGDGGDDDWTRPRGDASSSVPEEPARERRAARARAPAAAGGEAAVLPAHRREGVRGGRGRGRREHVERRVAREEKLHSRAGLVPRRRRLAQDHRACCRWKRLPITRARGTWGADAFRARTEAGEMGQGRRRGVPTRARPYTELCGPPGLCGPGALAGEQKYTRTVRRRAEGCRLGGGDRVVVRGESIRRSGSAMA
jgi:hypothetical protein